MHTNLGWASYGKCSKPSCFQNLGFWSLLGIAADFLRGLTVANSLLGTSGLVGTSRREQASILGPQGEREKISDPGGPRTHDLRNRLQLLYELSNKGRWELVVGN